MSEVEIDEQTRAALGRLTDNEKECLRRRLRHQTAKEMALDLGVSPHAVEKRLKMARAKLGLSSSLEAARLLAASEGYQRPGPQAADLLSRTSRGQDRVHRPLLWGVPLVIVAAVVLTLFAQTSGSAPDAATSAPPRPAETLLRNEARQLPSRDLVEPTPGQTRAFVDEQFALLDKDRSGFIERREAPPQGVQFIDTPWDGPGHPPREWLEQQKARPLPVEPHMAQAAYVAQYDTNADGKASLEEFRAMMMQRVARSGVPRDWSERHAGSRE